MFISSDDGNHTFLQYACDHGYDDIVKYLLGQFNSVTKIYFYLKNSFTKKNVKCSWVETTIYCCLYLVMYRFCFDLDL